jgi:hypothetical protein
VENDRPLEDAGLRAIQRDFVELTTVCYNGCNLAVHFRRQFSSVLRQKAGSAELVIAVMTNASYDRRGDVPLPRSLRRPICRVLRFNFDRRAHRSSLFSVSPLKTWSKHARHENGALVMSRFACA